MIGEANYARGHGAYLTHDLWRMGWRKQADPICNDCRRERDRKMITVAAGIEDRDPARDYSRQLLNIGEKLPCGHRFARAIRHRRFRRSMGKQSDRFAQMSFD